MSQILNNHDQAHRWKVRGCSAGIHLFNRANGLNILLDEAHVPHTLQARSPRQISIALTNRCDLTCAHCYAPKTQDRLDFNTIATWLKELDEHGALGVGFGGGEPTLHPDFLKICQFAAQKTQLSVSFTTHGHHINSELAEQLRGNIHFIRVSMDGVGETYESIRRRSFKNLLDRLRDVKSISRFGVNVVVNSLTLPELDKIALTSVDAGACELLLLPQMPVRNVLAASVSVLDGLRCWVDKYKGPLKLCINETSAEGFPICDPLIEERGLRAYAHIDATGVLKSSSYSNIGVPLQGFGVIEALDMLQRKITMGNNL